MTTVTIPPDSNLKNQIITLLNDCIQQVAHPIHAPDELLDDAQAAKVLGLVKGTLAVWRHQGKGPQFVKIGSNVRYKYSDLQNFISSKTYKP